MMKRILMASAVLMSAPAFAQDAAPAQTTVPTAQTSPANPVASPPEETSDVIGTSQAAPADTTTQTAQAPAQAGQVATGTQIAQIVDAEFPKYDKDGKGQLSEGQFGEWMIALRAASEPGVTADKPGVKAWVKQAFASADADKSKAVSKAELTTFLSKSA